MNQTTEKSLSQFQTLDTDLLASAARGEIDLNQLAKIVLSRRGQDENGKWIGFKQAAELHQVTI